MNAHVTLGPNQLVARATQLAADGIGAVDTQIAAVSRISIDPGVVPALAGDLAALKTTLGAWGGGLRAEAVGTLQKLVVDDRDLAEAWAGVNRTDTNAMLAFARVLQGAIQADEAAVAKLQGDLAPFDDGISASLGRIRGDQQNVDAELAAARQRAAGLQSQANALQDKIDYYKSHPWELILAGLSLPVLIAQLVDLISAIKTANEAMSKLAPIEAQIAQLANAQGPLLALSMGLTGLAGGVGNMVTALQQTSAALQQIIATPPLAPILSAQLEAMMQDLSSSSAIASEILQGA